jgi:sulfur transfer complex TusBCD TusB component (DsrH family)
MKSTFFSTVKDGKLQKNTTQNILQCLAPLEGKRVVITIEKQRSSRSLQQNKLYWVYIDILSKELGHSKDEMHELVKYKFLKLKRFISIVNGKSVILALEDGIYVDVSTGEIHDIEKVEPYDKIGSTTTLTKSEFIDFVDNLITWAKDFLGITLPSPEEQQTINY